MAVSKMEKMTIIAAAEKEAAILQAIQGLQIVEVKRIFHSPEERVKNKRSSCNCCSIVSYLRSCSVDCSACKKEY